MTREHTRHLLRKQGLAPHKKLGQNFLVHKWVPQKIVDLAGVHPLDTVVEVGVGLGALTLPLAKSAAHVIGLEADAGLVRLHQQQQALPANVTLRHADALKVDFATLAPTGERIKLIANLPYSISTPFLFRLIEHADRMAFAVVMLQKEVAKRLMAEPGSKAYGAPTVLLAACATVRPLLEVGPEAFHPRPKVDSLVVRLDFHPVPERVRALGEFNRPLFTRIVRAVFGRRRKTLLNGLAGCAGLPGKEHITEVIVRAGLAPSVRAETLSLETLVRLTRLLEPGITPSL
ncbi:MAG: 16S rRNA (adenine(1518)-N(6)/adenine(1519)-N(6))-dimethyltransferase RsmA [Desulfobulbus sp.]|jgi:16S rRNA (adenine1518-N6/adenine1519-N6)-dimethyltransferase